jgi:hypothetical protein
MLHLLHTLGFLFVSAFILGFLTQDFQTLFNNLRTATEGPATNPIPTPPAQPDSPKKA